MPRSNHRHATNLNKGGAAPAPKPVPSAGRTPRIVLASPAGEQRDAVVAALKARGCVTAVADSTSEAAQRLEEGAADVVVVDDGIAGPAWDLLSDLKRAKLGRIAVIRHPSQEDATRVARMRVHQVLTAGLGDATALALACIELAQRVRAARKRRAERARLSRRLQKLRRAHTELMRQMGVVCSSFGDNCRTIADQLHRVALGAEFNALIRQELELEGLLRTTLEYVLKKAGSTNAAIFLPSTSGDYSLGAYINYDLPRDSAETLLEQLANVLAPACEVQRELTIAKSAKELGVDELGGDHWLGDSAFGIRACWSDDECIAVLAIFRDRRNAFPESMIPSLSVITDLFGAQLARVIKTHYRHKPKEEWGASDAAAA